MAVSVYTFAPGRSVGVRAFPSSEVVLSVVEGSVIVTGWTDGQRLTAGSVTLIPKGRAFGVYNPGPRAATVMQVSSPPAWNADLQRPERRPRARRSAGRLPMRRPEGGPTPGGAAD
jgi:mannose-6-phosphate isomerase-like protein (cupin superfamily)